ncbi:hypothetical protein GF412_05495 [Candidatus Micrarchaeota archaeon]|nr:hypothetical protein [Candidatus Micrarchaeota archaeon]MBD3418406.1 hypothetical protein [Candidatus Micrarchaeota archaeon]
MEDRLAAVIVVLVVFSLILVAGMQFYEEKVQVDDATDYVLEDLVGKHPTADALEIMDWETRTNEQGEEYLRIRARVTEGLYTPCPVRVHYFYHYPVQNFVTDPKEYITSSECTVCEGEGCVIGFEEEAIIASHTNSRTQGVHNYVTTYNDAVPVVYRDTEGWKVKWDSSSANFGYLVKVAKNGEVSAVDMVYY